MHAEGHAEGLAEGPWTVQRSPHAITPLLRCHPRGSVAGAADLGPGSVGTKAPAESPGRIASRRRRRGPDTLRHAGTRRTKRESRAPGDVGEGDSVRADVGAWTDTHGTDAGAWTVMARSHGPVISDGTPSPKVSSTTAEPVPQPVHRVHSMHWLILYSCIVHNTAVIHHRLSDNEKFTNSQIH